MGEPLCHRCEKREAILQGMRGKRVCGLCFDAEQAAKAYVEGILTDDVMERIFNGESRRGQ